jgi:HAD superfamily hydrolase (TIGR01509 family)
MPRIKGFLFDQDGVIIDTERDGHRVAFNRAFFEFGLDIQWDPVVYHGLLRVAGGKERLRHFLRDTGRQLPVGPAQEDGFIATLHRRKTDIFLEMLEAGALPLRPGVRRLMQEINELRLFLGVCTTSDERAARAVTSTILKAVRFDLVLAGDVVARKKPDPEIYTLALRKAGLDGSECIAIEDSHNGVEAAKNAGLFVVATTNPYTEHEDLGRADIVVTCLGDPDGEKGILRKGSLPHDGVLRARQLAEYFSR